MVREVQALLSEFEALATFFLVSDHVVGHEAAMLELLSDGHELANHCARDRLYSRDTAEDFEKVLLSSERVCEDLRARARKLADKRKRRHLYASCDSAGCGDGCGALRKLVYSKSERSQSCIVDASAANSSVRWFRAPGGSLSSTMCEVLDRHGFTHVLCDAYANDPWISDPEFLASTLLSHTSDGSIIVIHMPERGFREYTFEAIRGLLVGLKARGLKTVPLTELRAAALSSKNNISTGIYADYLSLPSF